MLKCQTDSVFDLYDHANNCAMMKVRIFEGRTMSESLTMQQNRQ